VGRGGKRDRRKVRWRELGWCDTHRERCIIRRGIAGADDGGHGQRTFSRSVLVKQKNMSVIDLHQAKPPVRTLEGADDWAVVEHRATIDAVLVHHVSSEAVLRGADSSHRHRHRSVGL
jgi:hypothetical protein